MAEVLKDRARAIERAIPELAQNTASVLSLELRRALAWLIRRGRAFDVVFADPPYNQDWGKTLLHTTALEKILKRDGVLVVEHSAREALDVPPVWAVTNTRDYGETMLSFLNLC
jgi:16S rRNA G966 N2-methylase RsmD